MTGRVWDDRSWRWSNQVAECNDGVNAALFLALQGRPSVRGLPQGLQVSPKTSFLISQHWAQMWVSNYLESKGQTCSWCTQEVEHSFVPRPSPTSILWSLAVCKHGGGRPRRYGHMNWFRDSQWWAVPHSESWVLLKIMSVTELEVRTFARWWGARPGRYGYMHSFLNSSALKWIFKCSEQRSGFYALSVECIVGWAMCWTSVWTGWSGHMPYHQVDK